VDVIRLGESGKQDQQDAQQPERFGARANLRPDLSVHQEN
jgi:hypothetical protein